MRSRLRYLRQRLRKWKNRRVLPYLKFALIIFGLLAAAAAVQAVPAAADPDSSNFGSIVGRIRFTGTPPEPKKLMVIKDVRVCAKADHFDERLVVGEDGGLKDAVISLQNITGGISIDSLGIEFVLDQKVCTYIPHVLIVPVGTPVRILNNDGILHNIHTYGVKNQSVNLAQPRFKKRIKMTFDEPENIQVRCDVHGWMSAWIIAVDHPYYAVTDSSGNFVISDVPPGTYTVNIWQESMELASTEVTVKADEEVEINYSFDEEDIVE